MGHTNATDHGSRERRDVKLQRAVGAIGSGRAASARGSRERGWGPASS